MAIRSRDFPPAYARALRRSLAVIRQRLEQPPGPMPHDLRNQLQAMLAGDRPIVDVVYGRAQGICQKPYARSAGYRILLCTKSFLPGPRSRVIRLTAVLFHELIHIARGWELDAEAFENAWFSATEGARPPDRNDWAIFEEDEYEGWWVHVDPHTRRVSDYADRLVVTFPKPTTAHEQGGRNRGGRGFRPEALRVAGEFPVNDLKGGRRCQNPAQQRRRKSWA